MNMPPALQELSFDEMIQTLYTASSPFTEALQIDPAVGIGLVQNYPLTIAYYYECWQGHPSSTYSPDAITPPLHYTVTGFVKMFKNHLGFMPKEFYKRLFQKLTEHLDGNRMD